MASITIKSAGEDYQITVGPPAVARGKDERFAKTLALIVDGVLEDYSPSLGGQASFVASQLKDRIGATVVSVEEPPSEKGVVY